MSPENTPIHNNPAPIIYISGSHREMGRQIGESCRLQVHHSIENAKALISATYDHLQLTWRGAQIQASKYVPFSEEKYPKYVEEIRGIAEGANISFEDLNVLNAMEGVAMDALHLNKCTSMAVNQSKTKNGHILIGHNEDWLPEDEPDVFIVHAQPQDEPSFIAFTYGGLLPNIGFNSFGIAQCCDSVSPDDVRIGIPQIIVARAVLSARSISEAIRYMTVHRRAAGYNHLLAHESGELYNIEVSANSFAVLYGLDGYLAHTNHYLDNKMQELEGDPDELISTRLRYLRVLRLLKETSLHDASTLQTILRDHVNLPDSVCNHSADIPDPLDRGKTICSLIMDLTNREFQLSWGNPCSNAYTTYHLNG